MICPLLSAGQKQTWECKKVKCAWWVVLSSGDSGCAVKELGMILRMIQKRLDMKL